jgi:hypothetical protein
VRFGSGSVVRNPSGYLLPGWSLFTPGQCDRGSLMPFSFGFCAPSAQKPGGTWAHREGHLRSPPVQREMLHPPFSGKRSILGGRAGYETAALPGERRGRAIAGRAAWGEQPRRRRWWRCQPTFVTREPPPPGWWHVVTCSRAWSHGGYRLRALPGRRGLWRVRSGKPRIVGAIGGKDSESCLDLSTRKSQLSGGPIPAHCQRNTNHAAIWIRVDIAHAIT